MEPYHSKCLEVALFLSTSAKETFAKVTKNMYRVLLRIISVEPSVVSTKIGFLQRNVRVRVSKPYRKQGRVNPGRGRVDIQRGPEERSKGPELRFLYMLQRLAFV